MKVLLVDDDSFVRKGLRSLLPWGSMGFNLISEAENGESAFEIALEQHPDLVITDVRMPIMDGIEFTKKLRETMVDTYIIILSAYSDFEYARAAINFGVNDYIIKPITKEKVNPLIQKVRDIVTDLEQKMKYRSMIINNGQIEVHIKNALQNSDKKLISSFFEYELPQMNLRIYDAKDCCLLLQNTLFNYMERNGYDKNHIAQLRIETLKEMAEVKIVGELYSHTYHIYMKNLQFMPVKGYSSAVYVKKIKEYIKENYSNTELSVERIAQVFHLNPVYTGALFKQYENITMSNYINNLRVESALEKLNDISFSITEISKFVGFYDSNYFTRVFKRNMGITPSEYRNILMSKDKKPE